MDGQDDSYNKVLILKQHSHFLDFVKMEHVRWMNTRVEVHSVLIYINKIPYQHTEICVNCNNHNGWFFLHYQQTLRHTL